MAKSKLSPIVLFVYNRQDHTRKTIEALKKNIYADTSDLIIFSDAPKNESVAEEVNEVRNYIKTITGFKSVKIIERKTNFGLANSIIEGVTKIVNKYGKVIVLEDDLVTSKYFLQFMNDALELYKNESKVACISGYVYPINGLPETFFIRGADCWGWATWKSAWNLFEKDGKKLLNELEKTNMVNEFDFFGAYKFSEMLKDQIKGKNNSWAVRWYASAFLKHKFTLYPGKSLVSNIGNDTIGTHSGKVNKYAVDLSDNRVLVNKIHLQESSFSKKKFSAFFSHNSNYLSHLFYKAKDLFAGGLR